MSFVNKILFEAIKLNIKVGDTILTGKWKNHKEVVKEIGEDEYGLPTVNGKSIMKIRLSKKEDIKKESIEPQTYSEWITEENESIIKPLKPAKIRTFFHGTPVKIKQLDDNCFINEIEQEGPGFYLTTDFDDAWRYGFNKGNDGFVYEFEWKYKKLVSTKKVSESILRKNYSYSIRNLIKNGKNWKENCQNWDEDQIRGFNKVIEQIFEVSESQFEAYQNIWGDFYKDDPIGFCKQMSKAFMSYDGVIIDKQDGVKHGIVYNLESLIIKKVHQL